MCIRDSIAAAKKLGYQISKLTMYPFGCGAEIEHIDHGSTLEEVIIILCGIGMHLFYPACFALMHRAGLISSAYQNYLTHLNASVMLFNLLPVYPLDGGRLLDCIMQSYGSCLLYTSVVFLGTKNQILKDKTIFIGSLDRTIVHPREIYKEAVKLNASKIICVHNHPSGDVTPSPNDITATQAISEAGRTVGIPLLDHLIVGNNAYLSFREQGLLPQIE